MVCIWHRICFAEENGTDEDFHFAEKHVRANLKCRFANNAKTMEMTDHNHNLT